MPATEIMTATPEKKTARPAVPLAISIAVWLSTPRGEGSGRAAEVRAGRAYMRLQLKATELGLQMHPMSQAVQEFAEMKPHYDRVHQLLVGRPAEEETVQMLCRIGYAPAQQHSPRRGVAAIVRA